MQKLTLTSTDLLHFQQLDERQKRLFAATQALKLGYYGVSMVCEAYKINRKTVYKGKKELASSDGKATKYIRQSGGVKKKSAISLNLLLSFRNLLTSSTAGLPQDANIKWTYLTQTQIQEKLEAQSIQLSRYYINMLLLKEGYKKRKMLKMNNLVEVVGRNEQFEKIANYRTTFAEKGIPILSIDSKFKELLGSFARKGCAYATEMRKRNDHDFKPKDGVKITPHGIYDVLDNIGYMTIGTSYDTSAFVCDNLLNCWTEHLQYKYPNADTILILCDGGGANASASYLFKKDLIALANSLNINILLAHYPPYCSKWNPIEHRLFSQVSHTWDGISLTDLEFVKNITDTTTTKTGLKVITSTNEKVYETKKKVKQEFKDNIKSYVLFDEIAPKWNYLIKPQTCPT